MGNLSTISIGSLIAAIFDIGPIPTLIARRLDASVIDVRSAIASDADARLVYSQAVERIAMAIEACNGDIPTMAKYLQVRASVVRATINENPYLRELVDLQNQQFVTLAKEALLTALNRGERWAVELVLRDSALGHDAGFGKTSSVRVVDEAASLGLDPAALKERLMKVFLEDIPQLPDYDV